MNTNIRLRFDQLFRQKTRVRLVNSYKGLPVASEAVITRVDQDLIQVECDIQQVACLLIERHTFIQSAALEGTLMASLLRLDPAGKWADLGDFLQVEGDIGQRQNVRVEPDEPVSVLLQSNSHASWVKGSLVDLSIRGIGASLERILVNPRYHTIGADLNVAFNLPIPAPTPPPARTSSLKAHTDSSERFGRDELRGLKSTGMLVEPETKRVVHPAQQREPVLVSGHGKVVYCYSIPPFTHYRLGISIERNDVFQTVVRPYITLRQADIIREFRGLYTLLARKINS